MNKKTFFLVIGIIGGVLLTSLLYFAFMFFVAFGGLNFLIPVPKPEVTHGEFPFQLTYEINGETKVIEDTVICEFDGFEVIGEAGKYRKWKIHVEGTGARMITLCDLRSDEDFTDWGNQVLELCFDPGDAEYYMGDIGDRQSEGNTGEWIDYLYMLPNGETGYSAFKADEAWEKYKIRIISWECAPPIKNKFR